MKKHTVKSQIHQDQDKIMISINSNMTKMEVVNTKFCANPGGLQLDLNTSDIRIHSYHCIQ